MPARDLHVLDARSLEDHRTPRCRGRRQAEACTIRIEDEGVAHPHRGRYLGHREAGEQLAREPGAADARLRTRIELAPQRLVACPERQPHDFAGRGRSVRGDAHLDPLAGDLAVHFGLAIVADRVDEVLEAALDKNSAAPASESKAA